MERRDFIKSACLTCVGSIGAAWLLQACTPQKYITNVTVKESKLVIKKSEFAVVKKDKTVQQKFILVKPENTQFPIAIYKVNENEYKALYLQCTHQGCELSPHETMMVCPCSMGTLARIATGISNDLMTRAADVILKERRKLILVPRETPLSLIHLKNMVAVTEAGGIMLPAIPSFYSKPGTVEEVISTVVDRLLDIAGFEIKTKRWGG